MKKRMLSLLCVLALCLGLLPVTALAVDAPNNLYVGNQNVKSGEDTTYWTTNDSGALDKSNENADWTVRYNPNTATLTLKSATIKPTSNIGTSAVIYAQSNSQSAVSLTIELDGRNTIECDSAFYGIYVDAEMSNDSYGTDASLTITGNGSLEVSGSFNGIMVKSGSGNASLTINNASVVAKTTQTHSGYAGVYVQSSTKATGSPQLSLAVNGGSLTTSASEGNDGIQFYVGSFQASKATTSLTVSENAIVDARNGGISASRISVTLPTPTPTGNNSSGIVFDGSAGTVYGSVTLQDDLKIKSGETLTVPNGSSLNCNEKLTNNGTILASGGTVTGSLSGGPAAPKYDCDRGQRRRIFHHRQRRGNLSVAAQHGQRQQLDGHKRRNQRRLYHRDHHYQHGRLPIPLCGEERQRRQRHQPSRHPDGQPKCFAHFLLHLRQCCPRRRGHRDGEW